VRDRLKRWPGEWKTDAWLLMLLIGVAVFFIGGRCVGR